jgi:hypothetical protein
MGGKFGKDKSHAAYASWEYLHTSVGSFDGGKCVGAHEYYYKQRDSCSYRWQAHHRATGADKAHYGSWNQIAFSNSAAGTAKKHFANRALNAPPTFKKKRATIAGLPFRTAFAPWNNNAHHLLPDAELRDSIFGVAGDSPDAQDLIIKGLLDNEYNINHWRNMMILPQDQDVGCDLSLPIHPWGDSHPSYSAALKAKVDAVLKVYKPIVQKMKDGTFEKDHEVPDPLDIVDALMAVSDTVHAQVLALKPVVAAQCTAKGSIAINQFSSQIATAMGV